MQPWTPRELDQPASGFDIEDCKSDLDGTLCSQSPLYSSAEATQGFLAAHPGGRAHAVREAWDLSVYRDWRDRTSALLNLKD